MLTPKQPNFVLNVAGAHTNLFISLSNTRLQTPSLALSITVSLSVLLFLGSLCHPHMHLLSHRLKKKRRNGCPLTHLYECAITTWEPTVSHYSDLLAQFKHEFCALKRKTRDNYTLSCSSISPVTSSYVYHTVEKEKWKRCHFFPPFDATFPLLSITALMFPAPRKGSFSGRT